MTSDIDWTLIDRHLAGEATAAERERLETWLAADPARVAWLDALRAQWTARGAPRDIDAAWTRVVARTTAAQPSVVPLRPRAPARRAWIGRAAAAAVLLVGGAALWRTVVAPTSTPSVAASMREVVAPPGRNAEVRLADGTHIVLNAGSTLRYGDDRRDVWLDGEGYFEVRHDAARPFRVHVRGRLIEDLGTRFVVRAYAEQRAVAVMVAEGLVALRRDTAATDSTVLVAGDLGTLAADGAVRVERGVDADRWIAWTTGALVLDDLSLRDAVPLLERRYDVRITIADARLANRRVMGQFRDRPLREVLDAIALALGARWDDDGKGITLRAAEAR